MGWWMHLTLAANPPKPCVDVLSDKNSQVLAADELVSRKKRRKIEMGHQQADCVQQKIRSMPWDFLTAVGPGRCSDKEETATRDYTNAQWDVEGS